MSENKRKADHSWWTDQITAGIRYREEESFQERWPDWRRMYRGEWNPGILPVNFFFMLLRAIVPRVYFRNPAISVAPDMPGLLCAAFAQILERIDNKLLIAMGIKKQIKKMIQDAFLFGTGCGKLGFGGQYSTVPSYGETAAPRNKKWGTVEYMSKISPNMPWFSRFHPKYLIVPYGCEDLDDSRWVANEIERPLVDVKDDPRLENTRDLVPTKEAKVTVSRDTHRIAKPIDMIKLYEIRDRKYRKAVVMDLDHEKFLFEGDDELQTDEGFPIFSLIFNNDDEAFWGIPDSMIIEPQQLEMNEIRTQIMKHRRLTLIKLLYQEGLIESNELSKMVSEDVMAAVKVKDINGVKPLQVSTIPKELIIASEEVRSDVREQIGFSRNQMGELSQKSGDTTATEASIVQMASEIRVDERQDLVAEMLTSVVRSMHEVIFKFWQEEQIIDIVGPAGIPLWVEFSGKMLQGGAYEVRIEPDSAQPMTKQSRRAMALQGYQLFIQNPAVDPVALTRYTLREFYGFTYEELMRGLPTGAGQLAPMEMNQYLTMMSNAQRMGLPMLPPGGQKGGEGNASAS